MVAGFTPQQQAGFQTIDNAQGIGFPYINAAAQQYGQATAPLWDDLPQFDTSGLATAGQDAIGRNSGFWSPALTYANNAGNLALSAPGTVAPYTQAAQGWGNWAGNQASNITQGVTGYLSPAMQYANNVGSVASAVPGSVAPNSNYVSDLSRSIPGGISPYSGYGIGAANAARQGIDLPGYNTLPTYLSPYTKNVTDALKDLFNQQNAEQFQQIRGNATTQGAYGGDREAVAEAITARQQQLGEAPAFSQALQSGFAQAQNELNTQQQIEQARQQAERQNAIASGQLGIGSGNLALSGYTGAGQLGLGAGNLTLGGYDTYGRLGLGASGAATGAGNLYSTTNLGAGQLGIGAGNLNLGSGNLALGGLNAGIQGSLGAGQGAIGAGNLNLAGGQQGFGEFNTQQAQQLAADQANRWLASQAGFGMSSLGNQALSQALTGANAQIGAGALQQQLAQEQLNIPYQQFLQAQAYPYQQLSFLSPIVEGTGSLSGGKGSTTYPGPSALSQIGGLGAAATGLSGLFGSGGGGGLQGTSGGSSGGVFGDQTGSAFSGEDFGGGFAKQGGRIGYARGGTTPDVPGVGNGVPILDLSYIPTETDKPVGSSLGIGIGAGGSQTTSGGGGGGGSLLGGIGQAVGAVKTAVDVGSAIGIGDVLGGLFFLKDGGRAGFALGGDTSDPTQQVDPTQSDPTKLNASTRWSLPKVPKISIDELIPLKGNAGPAIKGKGPPDLQAMPQQMPGQPQDSGLKGIGDLGKSLKGTNLFGSSDDSRSSDSTDKGYAGGGVPLSAAINFGGGSPGQSMQVDELRRLPLERLYEMSVRFPQNTPQGQMVARVLNEKRMTPGEGTAPTGAPAQAGAGQAGGMGMGGGYGAANAPAAGGMGGQPDYSGGTSHLAHGGEADAEPGFVTEDELDPHPIVDHSGDSVVIRYPSEGKTLDLGLPSIKEGRRHYAAGGSSRWASMIDPAFTAAPGVGGVSVMSPNGVGIPQLATTASPEGNWVARTAGNQTLAPGGGLGNWFQAVPQRTQFGTGPGGSTIYPNTTAFTPGMASVINGLTKGKGTIPPEFGGASPGSTPPASATQSQEDINNAIFQQFLGPFGVSDSGGNRRGGRIGYAEGGTPFMADDIEALNRMMGQREGGFVPSADGEGLVRSPYEPTYGEYEKLPMRANPAWQAGLDAETGAAMEKERTGGREAELHGALSDLRGKQAESPVFPRPYRSDMIHWPRGSIQSGGRIGYAEGGEMDDPSEAPPPREREPDDSGLTALAREQRQLDTPDIADVVKSRAVRSVVRDPPPESREQVVAPKRPAGMRSPLTDSLSLDDLLDKYERTKPPGEGYADIPPPEDRPIPDHREFTAPIPGIGSPAATPVPVTRKDEDFGAAGLEPVASYWQKPGAGFTDPLSGEVLHAPTGGKGLGDYMPAIGETLQAIYNPKPAMPEGPPMMTQPTSFVAKPEGIGATATAEGAPGLGQPAKPVGAPPPPTAPGLGQPAKPAQFYRDGTRLADITGGNLRLPGPFQSLTTAATPTPPAAAAAPPPPNVTRVTSPAKVVQPPEPPKEAATPAAAAPKIDLLSGDAITNGKIWRNGEVIGPASAAGAPAKPTAQVTAAPQAGGAAVEFGGSVPAVVHPGRGYYQEAAGKFTGGNPGNWMGVGDSLAVGYIRNAGLGGTAATLKTDRGAADADAAGGRSPQEVLNAIRAHPERYQGKNVLLSGGVSNDPSQVNLVPQQIKALQDAHAAKIRVLGVGNREGDEGGQHYNLAPHNAQLEQYAKGPVAAPAPATGELERAYPNDPRQGQGAGSVPPPASATPGSGSNAAPETRGLPPTMHPIADALTNSPEAKQLGLTKANAAGFLGQLPVESYGGDPTARARGDQKDGSDSRGIVQWDPNRWANGVAWAQKNGLNDFETNAATQTRFALYEVLSGTDGSNGRTLAALKAAGDDPAKSALAWLHFERPRGYQSDHPEYGLGSDQRTYNAERIFGALNGGTPFSLGMAPGRSRGLPQDGGAGAGSGGGPRQPGPGQPDEVIADKNGAPKVTPAGQTKVDDFKSQLLGAAKDGHEKTRLQKWMDSPSFLLFMIGAGMLASRSPFPGVALGEGLLAAGKSAQSIRSDQNREQLTEARVNQISNTALHQHELTGVRLQALAQKNAHELQVLQQQAAALQYKKDSGDQSFALKQQVADSQAGLREARIAKLNSDMELAQHKALAGELEKPTYQEMVDPADGQKKGGLLYAAKIPDASKPLGGGMFIPGAGGPKPGPDRSFQNSAEVAKMIKAEKDSILKNNFGMNDAVADQLARRAVADRMKLQSPGPAAGGAPPAATTSTAQPAASPAAPAAAVPAWAKPDSDVAHDASGKALYQKDGSAGWFYPDGSEYKP